MPARKKFDLIIVPTVGCEDGEPTYAGTLRLSTSVGMCMTGVASAMAILGGYRKYGPGEASAYFSWVQRNPAYDEEIVRLVKNDETCTPRDLWRVLSDIRICLENLHLNWRTAKIGVCTYEAHFERIRVTLTHLGFKSENIIWIDSNEPESYSRFMENLLLFVTRIDPTWQWLGRPLAWQASKRAWLCDTIRRGMDG